MNQEIKRWEFFLLEFIIRITQNIVNVKYMLSLQEKTADIIKDEFPFTKYFENAPQPIFKGRSYAEDMDMAEGCFRHIKKIFTQLEVRNIVWKLLSYYLILKHCSWILFTTQYSKAIYDRLLNMCIFELQSADGKFLYSLIVWTTYFDILITINTKIHKK